MNAYEKRRDLRKQKNQLRQNERRAERRVIKDLDHHRASILYEEAFVALQGRKPLVIPKVTTKQLNAAAHMMFARLHELELGGQEDE